MAASPYPVAVAMSTPSPNDPPLALKLAIVLGVVTLLVGLAGAIYLRLIRSDADSPGNVAIVQLTNVPQEVELQLTATWSVRDQVRSEEGQAGTDAGVWAFHLAPVRESLTLTVWRVIDGIRAVWIQRAVVFDHREPVVVQLPD